MRIHRIRGIMASSYLIESEDLFLVDAGFVGTGRIIARKIRSLGRRLDELKLVLVTHPHLDHYGGLPELRDDCDFEVGCHPRAEEGVRTGGKEISPGHVRWARAVARLGRACLPHVSFRGTPPTLLLEDGQQLGEYGLPGRIVHTPGHTDACISLLLDDGSAFIGDLAMGKGGMTPSGPRRPAMAVSRERAYESWRKLLAAGAKNIYPAHAGLFSAAELTAVMQDSAVST